MALFKVRQERLSRRKDIADEFEDRLMFETDQMNWPKLMATSISVIHNADYLTPQRKRDILYNNAARFLRIDQKETQRTPLIGTEGHYHSQSRLLVIWRYINSYR